MHSHLMSRPRSRSLTDAVADALLDASTVWETVSDVKILKLNDFDSDLLDDTPSVGVAEADKLIDWVLLRV